MPLIEKTKWRRRASRSAEATPPTCDAVTEPRPFVSPATAPQVAASQGGSDRDIVVANLRSVFLTGFAANTPERRLLAAKLSKGLTRAAASDVLGVSPKMIQRGETDLEEKPTALLGQVLPKQKRQKMDPQDHQLALALLDTLAPVQSGHPWRVVRSTEDHLYESYVKCLAEGHPQQKPVSKSYFLKHILDKKHNSVHHENAPDFCVRCQRCKELQGKKQSVSLSAEEEMELEKLQWHSLIQATQWKVFHQTMARLEQNPDLVLIVQDFNKQETNSLDMQVLSIVLYEAKTGGINRHYFHYFLPPGVANDIIAVIACHRLFSRAINPTGKRNLILE